MNKLSSSDRKSLIKFASQLPKGSRERKAILAGLSKISHRPVLTGVTLSKYRAGEAMMMYHVDLQKNHSKFYEMAVVLDEAEGDGSYMLQKRWGALTDSGAGRVESKDEKGLDYDSAVQAMKIHGGAKLRKGYQDAFKTRPVGQYPVGLSRSVGFGWGTQKITKCVPALREFTNLLKVAVAEAMNEQAGQLFETLRDLQALLSDIPDSSMAAEIRKLLHPPFQRIQKNPRFVSDPERTAKELVTLRRYIDRQIAECNV